MSAKYVTLVIAAMLSVPAVTPILEGEWELVDRCRRGITICYEVRFDEIVRQPGYPSATHRDNETADQLKRPADGPHPRQESP